MEYVGMFDITDPVYSVFFPIDRGTFGTDTMQKLMHQGKSSKFLQSAFQHRFCDYCANLCRMETQSCCGSALWRTHLDSQWYTRISTSGSRRRRDLLHSLKKVDRAWWICVDSVCMESILFDLLLHPCRAFNKVPVTSSAIPAVSKLITVDFHLETTAWYSSLVLSQRKCSAALYQSWYHMISLSIADRVLPWSLYCDLDQINLDPNEASDHCE